MVWLVALAARKEPEPTSAAILLLAYSMRMAPRSELSRKVPWRAAITCAAHRTSWYSMNATGDPPLLCMRRRQKPGKLCNTRIPHSAELSGGLAFGSNVGGSGIQGETQPTSGRGHSRTHPPGTTVLRVVVYNPGSNHRSQKYIHIHPPLTPNFSKPNSLSGNRIKTYVIKLLVCPIYILAFFPLIKVV